MRGLLFNRIRGQQRRLCTPATRLAREVAFVSPDGVGERSLVARSQRMYRGRAELSCNRILTKAPRQVRLAAFGDRSSTLGAPAQARGGVLKVEISIDISVDPVLDSARWSDPIATKEPTSKRPRKVDLARSLLSGLRVVDPAR
jgi:hypothetical protein